MIDPNNLLDEAQLRQMLRRDVKMHGPQYLFKFMLEMQRAIAVALELLLEHYGGSL